MNELRSMKADELLAELERVEVAIAEGHADVVAELRRRLRRLDILDEVRRREAADAMRGLVEAVKATDPDLAERFVADQLQDMLKKRNER